MELFRAENVPLETEISKHVSDYDKISGAMVVQFRSKEYTLQQLARFIEEPDRHTREEAWRLSTRRRLQDRATRRIATLDEGQGGPASRPRRVPS